MFRYRTTAPDAGFAPKWRDGKDNPATLTREMWAAAVPGPTFPVYAGNHSSQKDQRS